MSQHSNFNRYFFDTDTFINIVHELEEIPERPLTCNDSAVDDLADEYIDLWRKLFGLTIEEARYLIRSNRALEDRIVIPDETIREWP
jgi:hypothetical protein